MYPPHHPSQQQISHSSVPPSQQYQSHQTSSVLQIAYISPQPSTQPLTKFPQVDSRLTVPVFLSTNNQLRTSSNPRNQATIQDRRVTVQQVQGRQGQSYAGTSYKGNATSSGGNNVGGQARVIKCYNCQGEGHMARHCTQPKRTRNAAWFKEKEIGSHGQSFNYGSNVISEVPHSDSYHNDMDNKSVHTMQDFEQTPVVDFSNNEIHSDSNIIPYSQYLLETQQTTVQDTNLYVQQDSMILSMIEQMSKQMINHVNNWEKANKEKNNESLTAALKRYNERVKTFEQRLNVDLSSHEKMIDS
ncbi:putative ribonuclease H-like domain-containing protein [Tanacetum coccineum]